MNKHGPWNTDDFDKMSWHDVHVHGFHFDKYNESEGTADLILDIDFILDWIEEMGKITFSMCRAELRFQEVFGLEFNLDYATPSAGMNPFSIDGIYREPLVFDTGYKSYKWKIPINWPKGSLEFQSPGFTQILVGTPVNSSEQSLTDDDR